MSDLSVRLVRCQYESLPVRAVPPLGLIRLSRLGRERFREITHVHVGLGRPSKFQEGDWVMVKSAEAIRATLDERDRLRGLLFTDTQWSYCGGTYQVERVVQRMLDDSYRMRRVSRTTTLRGVTCEGIDNSGGCGADCALFFRDEWLEPAGTEPAELEKTPVATVRPLEEIRSTLDGQGRVCGTPFTKNMERYVGKRFAVASDYQLSGLPFWKKVHGEWYVLEGVRCGGEPLAEDGPCHRQCGLLWHRSWLTFDDELPSQTDD